MTQYVFRFGGGISDGKAGDKSLLGGKGANLAEMCRIGLPVPPGFTITTEACVHYYSNGQTYPEALKAATDITKEVTEVLGRTRGIVPDGHREEGHGDQDDGLLGVELHRVRPLEVLPGTIGPVTTAGDGSTKPYSCNYSSGNHPVRAGTSTA